MPLLDINHSLLDNVSDVAEKHKKLFTFDGIEMDDQKQVDCVFLFCFR